MQLVRETAALSSRSPRRRRKKGWLAKLRRAFSRRQPTGATEEHVRCIIAWRRAREAALGRELFGEPAWDLLLEIYAARLAGNRPKVSELAISIGLPQSTASRWIRVLSEHGLLACCERAGEGAEVPYLNPKAEKCLEYLLDHWTFAFCSI